jgi:putative FmdB family regulatory protein
MPIYDYECTQCHAVFEELIRSSRDEEALLCAQCGSPEVARQVSRFSMGRSERGGTPQSSKSCSGSCGSCRSGCCH